MKKVRFLLLAAMVAMFTGCQKEVAEQELDNNKPTPTGDTRIIIEGEGMIGPVTRSSDGKVEFEGGYATGAGLYNGDAQPKWQPILMLAMKLIISMAVRKTNSTDMIMHNQDHLLLM